MNYRGRVSVLLIVLTAGLLGGRAGQASPSCPQGVAAVAPRRLALRGGAASSAPSDGQGAGADAGEGPLRPLLPCDACGGIMGAGRAVELRAERAERRAAELGRRLEHLEHEFCVAEAALVQARKESADAVRAAEGSLRAQFERQIAELNDRCNRAEAEVRWGNGERTRDLIVISELRHKIDEHERERSELEDKIRREMGAGESSFTAAQRSGPVKSLEVDLVEDGGQCWCGAKGDAKGDLAGDDGWTGLEGSDSEEREGPKVLPHADGCGTAQSQGAPSGNGVLDDFTPLELFDKLRASRSAHSVL
jgi:hypothetical protein